MINRKFHLNDLVRVRLTKDGKEHLEKSHQRAVVHLPPAKKPIFKLPKEDECGWSNFQLWLLICSFGDYPQYLWHTKPPFEAEIEFDSGIDSDL